MTEKQSESKKIQKKLINNFLDNFLINLYSENKYIRVNNSYYAQYKKDFDIDDVVCSEIKFDNNEAYFTKEDMYENNDDFKLFKELFVKKLLKNNNPYFFKKVMKINTLNYKFFSFLINHHLGDFYNDLSIKHKRDLFDYMARKKNLNCENLLKIIKQEDYSKVLRIIFVREETYVNKESLDFAQKIIFLQNKVDAQILAEFIKNVYNVSNNIEKNIIVTLIKETKDISLALKKELLDLEYVIDNNKEEKAFNELSDLMDESLKYKEMTRFDIYINIEKMEKVFNGLITKQNLNNLLNYCSVSFPFEDNYITLGETQLRDYFYEKHPCKEISIIIESKKTLSDEEKERYYKIFKATILNILKDNIRKFSTPSVINQNKINTDEVLFYVDNVIKKDREIQLMKNLKDYSQDYVLTKKISKKI